MDIISIENLKQEKKYTGSCCGNSFIILDCRDFEPSRKFKVDFAFRNINKYGVDSALFLKKSVKADVFMEIFEKDGSESESCGNGMILVAYLLNFNNGKIETMNSTAVAVGNSERQAIIMNAELSNVEQINDDKNCLFVKMGEPHIIYLVDNLKSFDLTEVGKKMQKEYNDGVNVDAIQKMGETKYLIRTYERGVFAETKSCGTGSLSAYLAVSQFNGKIYEEPIEFKSAGGSHWVSRDKNMLKLETLKNFCKIKSI